MLMAVTNGDIGDPGRGPAFLETAAKVQAETNNTPDADGSSSFIRSSKEPLNSFRFLCSERMKGVFSLHAG